MKIQLSLVPSLLKFLGAFDEGSTSSSLLDDKTGLWNGVGLVGGVTLYLRSGGIIKQEVKEFPQLELEESMDEWRTERLLSVAKNQTSCPT
ncbi:Actin-related protein 3 [Frankliniella fusca]|uniref:Actin-related protein 3 n=1 Tax=Frankliniella fusca TaxID=407009 RepID=A0AAE1L8N0_9NEOP|nr:Actin-related protein 3 [Frankliniella fusca]